MPSLLHSATLLGAEARLVDVQVDLSLGLPGFYLAGLPDHACLDARLRVQTALRSAGFSLPQKRITVNLAPADLRKEGASFDLPIALGVLAAAGLVAPFDEPALVAGELTLAGEVLPIRGALPLALEARHRGVPRLIVPAANGPEAAVVQGVRVFGVRSLAEAAQALAGGGELEPVAPAARAARRPPALDFSEVRGQAACKRALEIAAAGGHNALLIGPAGSGKTMLARRFPTVLPELDFDESLEATAVWSVAGALREPGLLAERPFRAPHHTVSIAGLVGGGSPPRPGEISLAHRGVLFLDELAEFQRGSLEALRQPLEDGELSVVRAKAAISLPARFQLLAAMNPCPCGHAFDRDPARCSCTVGQRQRYFARVSGPILDRIDLHVEAPPLAPSELLEQPVGEPSAVIRARVIAARERQARRLQRYGVRCNGELRGRALRESCAAGDAALAVLLKLVERARLSARSCDRVLKLARTIADLAATESVLPVHVLEASQLRCLDRVPSGRPDPGPSALEQARLAAVPTPGGRARTSTGGAA